MLRYILLLFIWLTMPPMAWAGPVVSTDRGDVQGLDMGDYEVYRGIPYAQAGRWKAPRAVDKWDGVLKATKFGAPCMQLSLLTKKIVGVEDCHFINIWVPKTNAEEPLPVMVWIHGGAFIVGSGEQTIGPINLYDGKALAREGKVIIVNFNYRLGPLGFMGHPDLAAETTTGSTGNYGMLDQVKALKWVQNNIAAFGGDPKRVTLFGESAGGASVLAHLASPLSRGLFSAAIVQSGVLTDFSPQYSHNIGHKIAQHFGVDDHLHPGQSLRKVSAEDIVREFPINTDPESDDIPMYGPTVDGYFLNKPVVDTIRSNEHNAVPLLIGSNADEVRHLLGTAFLQHISDKPSDEEIKGVMLEMTEGHEPLVNESLTVYNSRNYKNNRNAILNFLSDYLFHYPAMEVAQEMEAQNPGTVYKYRYSKGRAEHAAELLPLWGHETTQALLTAPDNILKWVKPGRWMWDPRKWFTPDKWYKPGEWLNPVDKAFNKQLRRWWTNFAHGHNPNAGDLIWPKFAGDHILDIKLEPELMTSEQLPNWKQLKMFERHRDPHPPSCENAILRKYISR